MNFMKMKKYLIMVLAIAISGVFVGCHEDELSGSIIEQKKTAFEEAFIQAFGQPDPTHNWGFRMPDSESLTRSENANANEWADPDKAYGGLLVPPPLTDEQIAVVTKYFQITRNITYEDPKWTNYFMQQVYKGYTNPKTGTDPNTGKPYSPECYKAADGNTTIYASNNMDHLAAIDGDFVDHINNFNHGDCSVNNTVLDNGYHTNDNKFHSDKIMYMKESTTKSFGYYNSNGSVRRTEYTGLVSYKTIMKALGSEADCLEDGWNRSFMGFDFEQMVGPEIITQEKFTWKGKDYPVLSSNQNMYCGIPYKKADGSDINDTDLQQEGFIDNLLAEGYLPVSGSANKKWVKVGGCADGYYSDWIVCLTQAKTVSGTPEVKQISQNPGGYYVTVQDVIESGRVMCEDLAGASGNLDDLDYNDIVFDAVIVHEYKKPTDQNGKATGGDNYDNKYFATVRLMAAGGTIPVEMVIPEENGKQNFDVHSLLGASDNVMINTLHKEDRDSVNGAAVKDDAKPITLVNKKDGTNKFYGVKYIRDIELNVLYANVSIALVDSFHAGTLKFLVPLGTKWAKERKRFDYAYPNFTEWVKDKYYNKDLFTNNVPTNLYDDLVGLNEDDFKSVSAPVYITGSETYSKTSVPATSTMSYPSSSDKLIYNFAATGAAPGYLCPAVGSETEESLTVTLSNEDKASIAENQTIRIYGVSIADWYVTTNISGSNEYKSYNTNGNYIDISVTSANIDQIKNGITIKGKHFTVTYVTIVGLSSTPSTPTVNPSGGNTGWTSTTYTNQDIISTTDLNSKGIVKGKAATIKITGTAFNWGSAGWEVVIKDNNYTEILRRTSNNNSELGQFDSNLKGYVNIPIESSILNNLLDTGGIRIYINLNGYTTVEIFQ